jgi:hypothetical protein
VDLLVYIHGSYQNNFSYKIIILSINKT